MEWWQSFFDLDFKLTGFDALPQENTTVEVEFLTKVLPPKTATAVLDLCCGVGRLTLPLAIRGYKMVGLDYTRSYLEILRTEAFYKQIPIRLVQADMRHIPFSCCFDAIINMWTSFGYFENEADNFLVLKECFRTLKPHGKMILTTINRDYLVKHFIPKDWVMTKDYILLEQREFNYTQSRQTAVRYIVKNGITKESHINIRVFSQFELTQLLEAAGFRILSAHGNFTEDPPEANTSSITLVAVKP